jgi:hypothetical protein
LAPRLALSITHLVMALAAGVFGIELPWLETQLKLHPVRALYF